MLYAFHRALDTFSSVVTSLFGRTLVVFSDIHVSCSVTFMSCDQLLFILKERTNEICQRFAFRSRCRDLIEEACWQEFSPSVMEPRANNTNPLSERAVYHIFRVFCFLAELKTDPLTGTVHVTISPEEVQFLMKG